MKDNILKSQDKLYFVSGYDGYKYIINLSKGHGQEAKVPNDTFNVLQTCVATEMNISETIKHIETRRGYEVILKEIELLMQRGII